MGCNMEEAYTWNLAFQSARKKYGKKIRVPKSAVSGVPARFSQSILSLEMGANRVYRDQQATDSFQIREYDGYYTVQLDRHNPEEGNAVAHAVTDALPYTAVAVGLGAAVLGGSS
jgi:hypothetical protein